MLSNDEKTDQEEVTPSVSAAGRVSIEMPLLRTKTDLTDPALRGLRLLTAASQGNIEVVRELLGEGVSPSSADYDKRTALHLAAAEGHPEVVTLLIKEGAEVNAIDRFGHTPLNDAVNHDHDDCAGILKEADAEFGSRGALEAKLRTAAFDNDVELATRLLKHGVNVNAPDYDKRTALHLAVAERNVEMVRLLLQYKADPEAMDRWKSTPYQEALRRATRIGADPIMDAFSEVLPVQHKGSLFSKFVVTFGLFEIAFVVLFGLFVKYSAEADGNATVDQDLYNTFYNLYPMYQDIHVMIYVGFGYLMVFLRKNGYSSVGYTFLIGAFTIQWFILTSGFWEGVWLGFAKIHINILLLARADFAAGAVLITYGVLLGKVTPFQMMFVTVIEVVLFSLNERIGLEFHVSDIGGAMTIHMFGAFFGLAATLVITKKSYLSRPENSAGYHSDIMAMIGTVFLWMYWPSFNAGIGKGPQQQRAVINTVLSISASCVTAFVCSYSMRREQRFNMVDIQNATLAGGVAMGCTADMLIGPGPACAIGAISGFVSVLGFTTIQPFLESKLGLHDTCGVLNLHAMPSIIGAAAGLIGAYMATPAAYGMDQLLIQFPRRDLRSANQQVLYQFYYILTSLGIAIGGGLLAGVFVKNEIFGMFEGEETFKDDRFWEVPTLETPYYFDKRGEIARELEVPLVPNNEKADGLEPKTPRTSRGGNLESRLASLEARLAAAASASKRSAGDGRVEALFEKLLSKLDKQA